MSGVSNLPDERVRVIWEAWRDRARSAMFVCHTYGRHSPLKSRGAGGRERVFSLYGWRELNAG